MTTNQQLELGIKSTGVRTCLRRHETRMARGRWWFARMRETVACAEAWPAPSASREEQILFSESKRN